MTVKDLAHKARWRARDAVAKTVGLRLRADGIRARGHSASDAYVFDEIFGSEDAYRRDELVPLMRAGTVVEVGAHKGYFTVMAAAVATRVLVFEPDGDNFGFLQQNVALNGFDNVTAVQEAVSDRAGTRVFTVSSETDARHTFFPTEFSGQGRTVEVQCTTLADVVRDYSVGAIDVLKLDCEGSEYDVLLGCDDDTMKRIQHVVLEVHESPVVGHTADELVDFLSSHGLRGELYDEHVRGDLRTRMGWFSRS